MSSRAYLHGRQACALAYGCEKQASKNVRQRLLALSAQPERLLDTNVRGPQAGDLLYDYTNARQFARDAGGLLRDNISGRRPPLENPHALAQDALVAKAKARDALAQIAETHITPRKLASASLLPIALTAGTGALLAPDEEKKRGAILGAVLGLVGQQMFAKKADYNLGLPIPGTPLGLSLSPREERLKGMNRWVPRSTLERAFEGIDNGYDDVALIEAEADRGRLLDPAIGAAAGAGLLHYALPKSGLSGAVAGGLGGLIAGGLYNRVRRNDRAKDMYEALQGVYNERGVPRFALQGQAQQTAAEAIPLTARGGGGVE